MKLRNLRSSGAVGAGARNSLTTKYPSMRENRKAIVDIVMFGETLCHIMKMIQGSPEIVLIIDEVHAAELDGWKKNRLLAIKLAARGAYSSAEVVELV